MFWGGLCIGFVLGAFVGLGTACLCVMSKEEQEQQNNNHKEK